MCVCLNCQAGSIIFLDFPAAGATGGLGPDFTAADFSLTTGVEGKWLAVSLSGKSRFCNGIGYSVVETKPSSKSKDKGMWN